MGQPKKHIYKSGRTARALLCQVYCLHCLFSLALQQKNLGGLRCYLLLVLKSHISAVLLLLFPVMLSRIAVVSCQFGRLLISSRPWAQFSLVSKSRNLGSFSSNIQEQKSQIWLVTYANNKLTTEQLLPPVSNCPPSILRLGIPPKCCGFEKQPQFSWDQYFQPPCRLDYPPLGSSDREQNSRPKTSAPMSFWVIDDENCSCHNWNDSPNSSLSFGLLLPLQL